MTKREQFANNARTNLAASLTDVATTLSVDVASLFPSDGNFRILIDSEIILVTSVSGTTFTIERGKEGTTGVAHDDGSLVTQLITDESIRQVIADDLLYANSKPLYHSITDENGDVLTASSFTWVNQGGATITDIQDTLYFTWPADAGANQSRGIIHTSPATPYTATIGFRPLLRNNDVGNDGFPQIQLGFRDSGTSRLVLLNFHFRDGSNGFNVVQMTSETVFSSEAFGRFTSTAAADMWLRVVDNGTNHLFKVSIDGQNWVTLLTQSRTAWTATPNQIYFGNDPAATGIAGSECALFHYSIANVEL